MARSLLHDRTMPGTLRLHTRQQKHRRVAYEARVLRYDGGAGEWSSLNMSAGGMFVTGSPLLAPGSEIEVGVWLPDGQELVARACVVWINDPATNDLREHVPAGMGMELVDLSEEDRAALRALLYGDADEEVLDAAELTEVGLEIGPYRILDLLGAGGMGEVYLAEHVSLGRRVALKRLNQQLARDPRATRRFFDEGRLVNRLRHHNILQIMDFISEGDDHYYVMELLEGDNLGELLDDHGPLPLSRALSIGAQLCDAVQAVHNAGIIHRDIKPGNVLLLDRPGNPDFVKLLDFGIAKLKGPDPERQPGVAVGTPAYMAPEQCLGEEPDMRADIYALGAVLFHMLTGRLVFEADTWSQMLVKQVNERPPRPTRVTPAALPRRLEKLILRCLRKNAWWRPSARDVGMELRAILAKLDSTSTLPPPGSAPDLPRRAAVLATVVAGTLAAAIAALVTTNAFGPEEPTLPPPVAATVTLDRSEVSTVQPTPVHVVAAVLETEPAVKPAPEPDDESEEVTHARARELSISQVTTMLRLAASHVRKGDHLAAVKLCHTILRDRQNSARTYRTLGIAYSHLRANRPACVAYQRYLLLAAVLLLSNFSWLWVLTIAAVCAAVERVVLRGVQRSRTRFDDLDDAFAVGGLRSEQQIALIGDARRSVGAQVRVGDAEGAVGACRVRSVP